MVLTRPPRPSASGTIMGVTRDFVDVLDDTLDRRCTCGCGVQVDAGSPSAWFASELCSRRWHGRRQAESALEDTLRRFRDVVASFARSLLKAFGGQLEVMHHGAAALDPAGRPALPRPAARIDPCTGLSSTPLGKPLFRPSRL